MTVLICPGVHSSALTTGFLSEFESQLLSYLVLPAEQYPPYSAGHILAFLNQQFHRPQWRDRSQFAERAAIAEKSLLLIGFSAGVVGAIGAAWLWQQSGYSIKALIALDGWGVPLYGDFPIHRLSHDYFTHWSSTWLERTEDSFYADPSVDHLDLWRSPQSARGWRVQSAARSACLIPEFSPQPSHRTATTAARFLQSLLERYGEWRI